MDLLSDRFDVMATYRIVSISWQHQLAIQRPHVCKCAQYKHTFCGAIWKCVRLTILYQHRANLVFDAFICKVELQLEIGALSTLASAAIAWAKHYIVKNGNVCVTFQLHVLPSIGRAQQPLPLSLNASSRSWYSRLTHPTWPVFVVGGRAQKATCARLRGFHLLQKKRR